MVNTSLGAASSQLRECVKTFTMGTNEGGDLWKPRFLQDTEYPIGVLLQPLQQRYNLGFVISSMKDMGLEFFPVHILVVIGWI